MTKTNDFTKGKILSPLLKFVLPTLGALVLQALYGAVDLLVVGKFGTAADISAVSTGAQIMQTITHVLVSLSVGITVLIGQYLGAGRSDKAGTVIASGIKLFGALGLVLCGLVPCCAGILSSLLNAPEAAFDSCVSYVKICGFGLLFIVAYNVLGSIFRGLGDSKTPLLAVGISAVLNVFGDLYFVAVRGMAASGAALATVMSQGLSVIICLIIIAKRGLPFEFGKASFAKGAKQTGKIVKLGLPLAIQNLLVSLSFMVIVAIVNKIGLVESAGMGVAEKVCAFIMLIPSAFSQSLSAFVAQNIGAGQEKRASKALFYSIASSFVIAIFIAWFGFFHGNILTGIFSTDPAVIEAGWQYLRAYSIDVLLTSWMFCFIGYFNGCGATTFVMLQGVVSAFFVRIPVSYFMSKQLPVSLFKIGLATPCSTMLQIILCVAFYIIRKKEQK